MRTAFIQQLEKIAAEDARATLVVGDLGFGVVVNFRDRFPNQFVNAGVAEQNMTGLAAGMALSGRVCFTYSIANFPTLRCLEQIRNDVCYMEAPVVVVAVGGGTAYGALGATHHATEDIAVLRALPGMMVVCPGDPLEARLATQALFEREGPAYLRLGRAGEPEVHSADSPPVFELGKAIVVRDSPEAVATVIATGGMLHNSVLAADELASRHAIETRVLSMHTVSPLDAEAVMSAARETDRVFTVEEHSINGGLGGAVAEVMAEHPAAGAGLVRLGFPPAFSDKVGTQEYMRSQYGLDVSGLVASIRKAL